MIGIVYKIYNDEECYIGSTIQDLDKRMIRHKGINNYCASKKIIDKGNYKVDVLEKQDIKFKEQILWREREWIEKTGNCINKVRPIITNKERIIRVNNKNKIYYKENKEKIKKNTKNYYQENKENCREYHKNRYEKIKEQLKEKILCDCGKYYTIYHKQRHLRTKKHQYYLNNNNI